jgi:hypothetical protein
MGAVKRWACTTPVGPQGSPSVIHATDTDAAAPHGGKSSRVTPTRFTRQGLLRDFQPLGKPFRTRFTRPLAR